MFCTNCGATNDDNAAFCVGCGKSLNAAAASVPEAPVINNMAPQPGMYQQPYQNAYYQSAPVKKKKSTGLIIGLIIGGLVLVACIVIAILLLGGGVAGGKGFDTSEQAANQMINWVFDEDWDAIYDDMPQLTSVILNNIADGGSSVNTMQQYKADGQSYYARYYGSGNTLNDYTLRTTDPLSGTDLQNVISTFFTGLDYQITGFDTVTFDFTYTDSNGSTASDYMDVICIQIEGRWYPIWYN